MCLGKLCLWLMMFLERLFCHSSLKGFQAQNEAISSLRSLKCHRMLYSNYSEILFHRPSHDSKSRLSLSRHPNLPCLWVSGDHPPSTFPNLWFGLPRRQSLISELARHLSSTLGYLLKTLKNWKVPTCFEMCVVGLCFRIRHLAINTTESCGQHC